MSRNNLEKFIKMVEDDKAVAQKAEEIGFQNFEGLIAYGKELGMEFDISDLEELKKSSLEENKELNDNELDHVSGGWLFSSIIRRDFDYRPDH